MAHAQGHDEILKQQVASLQCKATLLEDQVRLLDEENRALVDRLRELGIPARRKSHIHVELPPPHTAPAPGNPEELALLTPRERKLFTELCGPEEVILLLLSESAVDVGHWIFKSRLWACATPTELVLFAAGRKPLIQKVPFQHIQESLYNHVTGELVLAPNRKFKLSQVRFSPVEGYQFLAQIYSV